jgi:hypothetical protein
MALNAGAADCSTGLSLRIYTAWTSAAGAGFVSPLTAGAIAAIQAQCHAIALAVVAEIQANAVVTGTATGSTVTGAIT